MPHLQRCMARRRRARAAATRKPRERRHRRGSELAVQTLTPAGRMKVSPIVALGVASLFAADVAAAQLPAAERDCREGQSPIMILGMYHMANPGLDAVNLDADDVLLPRRQREIQELVNRLAKFRPTKI